MPERSTPVLIVGANSAPLLPHFESWPHIVDRADDFLYILKSEVGGNVSLVFLESDVSCYRLESATPGYRNAQALSLALDLKLKCIDVNALRGERGLSLPAFFGSVVFVFSEPRSSEESSLTRAKQWLVEYEKLRDEVYAQVLDIPTSYLSAARLRVNLFRTAIRDISRNRATENK